MGDYVPTCDCPPGRCSGDSDCRLRAIPLPSSVKPSDEELVLNLLTCAANKEAMRNGVLQHTAAMYSVDEQIELLRLAAARLSVREGERSDRQRVVLDFVRSAFGAANAVPRERAKRLLEEAFELAQAAGVPAEEAQRLGAYTYARPRGDIAQEIGGLGVTILAMAESVGASADAEEQREIARVLAKPREHWTARHNAKADAGVADPAPLPKAPA